MTLDAQDIAAICEALLPRIRDEILAAANPLPSSSDQIKAFAKDPDLARQMFKRKRKPAQAETRQRRKGNE